MCSIKHVFCLVQYLSLYTKQLEFLFYSDLALTAYFLSALSIIFSEDHMKQSFSSSFFLFTPHLYLLFHLIFEVELLHALMLILLLYYHSFSYIILSSILIIILLLQFFFLNFFLNIYFHFGVSLVLSAREHIPPPLSALCQSVQSVEPGFTHAVVVTS